MVIVICCVFIYACGVKFIFPARGAYADGRGDPYEDRGIRKKTGRAVGAAGGVADRADRGAGPDRGEDGRCQNPDQSGEHRRAGDGTQLPDGEPSGY